MPEATLDPHSLEAFQEMLSPGFDGWYNGALASVFSRPEQMDVDAVFGKIFSSNLGWEDCSDEEEAYLIGEGLQRHYSLQKRPAEELDAALQYYFGITLYDVNIPDSWIYYAETDCYYTNHNSAYVTWPVTVLKAARDNDITRVYYEVEFPLFDSTVGNPYMVLTLRWVDDHYVVVSNQPVLLASHQLTGVLLWQDTASTFRLEKGEMIGPAPIELPDSYIYIALVDAEREDGDVSIHFLTENGTIVYDLYWDADDQAWAKGQLTIPAPTLNIAEEPPLDEVALSIDVPDFLTEEQQLLFRKAYRLHSLMYGGDTQYIDYFDADTSYRNETAEYGIHTYQIAAGRYKNWSDFDAVIHSVFTDRHWQEQNGDLALADGSLYRTYMEYDGQLAILATGRGVGCYNDNFADKFKLVSKTDSAIEFTVTGHYSFPFFLAGESQEERDHRLATTYDFILEYTIRMVLTEEGWRFDEYHCVQTDDWMEDLSGLLGLE